jgi:hypothetical protein
VLEIIPLILFALQIWRHTAALWWLLAVPTGCYGVPILLIVSKGSASGQDVERFGWWAFLVVTLALDKIERPSRQEHARGVEPRR